MLYIYTHVSVTQVLNYFSLKFPSKAIFDEPAIMASLPRELRRKLTVELFDEVKQVLYY